MNLDKLKALIAAADWSSPDFKAIAEGLVDVVEAAHKARNVYHPDHPEHMDAMDLALATLAARLKESGL